MGRSTPTFREFTKEWSSECLKMLRVLPEKERSALKNLLDVVSSRSDAGSLMPSPLPSETALILMAIHLKAELNDLKTAIGKNGG
jgi:hypothetical protein